MTQQPAAHPPTEAPRPDRLDQFFDHIRAGGIYRRRERRWIGGVCSGLATRLNVDPVLVRIAAVFAGMFFGLGVTAYLVAWVLLPDENGSIHAERAWRERYAGSVILVVITVLSVLSSGRDDRGPGFGLLAVGVAVGIWYLVSKRTPPPIAAGPGRGHSTGHSPYGGASAARPADRDAYPQDARPGDARWQATTAAPVWRPPQPTYATGHVANRRRTGGPFVLLLTIGLSLLAYWGVRMAADAAGVQGSHHLLGMAAVVGVLGVMLIMLGLVGRRGGLISLAASILAIAVTVASFGAALLDVNLDAGVGEQKWSPSDVAQLQPRYEWTAGDAVLDLSGLDAAALAGRRTNVVVGVGKLTVVLPKQADAKVAASIRGGELIWFDDAGARQNMESGDQNLDRTLTFAGGTRTGSNAATSPGSLTSPNPMTIDAGVQFGELHIEQR